MTRVGKTMFSISLFFAVCVCVCVVPNQSQLFIVVSDWGSYIGCHFPFGFCGVLFSVFVPDRTVRGQICYICLSVSCK